jgi:hypothetical protein
MTQSTTSSSQDFAHSSLRESLLEHLLVGAVMRQLWKNGLRDFEVLRSQTDASGYDVVIYAHGITRHIQLKSTYAAGKASRQTVNIALAQKPSGCVVWMFFDETSLEFTKFLWFGGQPGQPLPDLGDRVAKHTKANSQGIKTERPHQRRLNKGAFTEVPDVETLCKLLFTDGP